MLMFLLEMVVDVTLFVSPMFLYRWMSNGWETKKNSAKTWFYLSTFTFVWLQLIKLT